MKTRIKLAASAFILGIIIGAAGLNWIEGYHLDKAELEIKRLELTLAEQLEKITVLETKLAAKKTLAVNELRIHVNLKDEFERLEVEAIIKKLLRDLKGKQLKEIDPNMVTNIIDQRIIETPEHKYRLTVKSTLISEILLMYIEAREVRDTPLSKTISYN